MTVNYGNTIMSMKLKAMMGYNHVNEPAGNVIWTNAYIASTGKKATQLQLPTSIFPVLDQGVSSHYYPGIPMKYPAVDSNADIGADVSYGMFFPKYSLDTGTQTAAANRWQLREYGFDTRYSLSDTVRRVPYPQILRDYHYTTTVTLSSALENTGANVSVPVPAGLFVTGIWVERISSGTWWSPMISIAPQGNMFPTNGANIVIRADMPGTTGNAWNYVANTYRIRIAGLLNPPFPLIAHDIPVGSIAANGGAFVENSFNFPSGFRLLGMYQVGKNGGNYYSRPWGVTSNLLFDSPGIWVITANPAFVSGALRSTNAGDLAVRVVGI